MYEVYHQEYIKDAKARSHPLMSSFGNIMVPGKQLTDHQCQAVEGDCFK